MKKLKTNQKIDITYKSCLDKAKHKDKNNGIESIDK